MKLLVRPIPALCMAALATVFCAAGAQAAPTLSQVDLRLGRTTVGIVQQGAELGAGSGLLGFGSAASDVFGTALGRAHQGVLGVAGNGGFGFAATDVIAAPPAVDVAASTGLDLSARGGVALSAGFLAGVNTLGGLTYFVAQSPSFSTSSAPGLLSTGSDLLNFDLADGQSLFGQDNALGTANGTGLLGTTADGRLRMIFTNGGSIGSVSMLSRPLGFAADTGLAAAAGFIVGINAAGSLNAYEPLLDLLFENIGPAGLFSIIGGLDTLDFGADADASLFDMTGDVARSRGVLGISAQGGLAYVRLDLIPSDPSSAAHAVLRDGAALGLDLDSGLVSSRGVVTALASAAGVSTAVPEPATAWLAGIALLAAASVRLRAHRHRSVR